MNFFIKLLITAGVAYGLSEILDGVHILNFKTAIIFALVLGFLNTFIKPILKFIGMPISIITLGLFSLVINAIIILLADYFIKDMQIDGFLQAFLFSILISLGTSLLNGIFVKSK